MVSVILKNRREEKELTKDSIRVIEDEGGNNWYQIPVWLKKIDKNLFAEYSFEDLPEHIKKQIQKPEKVY